MKESRKRNEFRNKLLCGGWEGHGLQPCRQSDSGRLRHDWKSCPPQFSKFFAAEERLM